MFYLHPYFPPTVHFTNKKNRAVSSQIDFDRVYAVSQLCMHCTVYALLDDRGWILVGGGVDTQKRHSQHRFGQ